MRPLKWIEGQTAHRLPWLSAKFSSGHNVACPRCGFLGLRPPVFEPPDPEFLRKISSDPMEAHHFWEFLVRLIHMTPEQRASLKFGDAQPACGRHLLEHDVHGDDLIERIRRERDCPGFFQYLEGRDPEQHFELLREHKTTERMSEVMWRTTLITAVAVILAAVIAFLLSHFLG